MATHDYVIANGTGAAVRSDLNNALAAIVSNNSGSSEPGTTYAYQWWADTNANVLKIRNSANNAWITLRELDGTMLIEDGSASTPGLAFADDLDTGFFRSAADKINFATGGAERLEIGSSEVVFNDPSNDVDFRVESNGNTHMLFVEGGTDRVGIGESDPDQTLHISEAASGTTMGIIIHNTATASNSDARLTFNTNSGGAEKTRAYIQGTGNTSGNGNLIFATRKSGSTSESARIDSSGRLLVGTSSARSVSSLNSSLQVEGTGGDSSTISVTRNVASAAPPRVVFGKSRGTSVGSNVVVQSGDSLGEISFSGADGTDANSVAATINCKVDGTPGSNDMPGRLMFSTTADGASSPTERMRITSSGRLGIGTASPGCQTGGIHVVHDATEGSPSFTGGEVAIFQRNFNSGQGCHIGIIGGSSGTSSINFGDKDDADRGIIQYAHGDDSMRFYTNAGERMRLTSNSDSELLLGTTSSSNSSGTGVKLRGGSSSHVDVVINAATNINLNHVYNLNSTNNGYRFYIMANGGIVNHSGNNINLSDEREKKNIVDMDSAWSDLKQWVLREFHFNDEDDSEPKHYGVIAQQIETVSPEVISDFQKDETTTRKGVKEMQMMWMAIKALQEAQARIETLETKVAALEAG